MEYIGIDIGSTCAKVAVLDEDENILHQSVQPTGWSSVDTAEIIKNMLLEKGICPETGKLWLPAMEEYLCPMRTKP